MPLYGCRRVMDPNWFNSMTCYIISLKKGTTSQLCDLKKRSETARWLLAFFGFVPPSVLHSFIRFFFFTFSGFFWSLFLNPVAGARRHDRRPFVELVLVARSLRLWHVYATRYSSVFFLPRKSPSFGNFRLFLFQFDFRLLWIAEKEMRSLGGGGWFRFMRVPLFPGRPLAGWQVAADWSPSLQWLKGDPNLVMNRQLDPFRMAVRTAYQSICHRWDHGKPSKTR